MSEQGTTKDQVCAEAVTKDGWHFMLCKKPAKYSITIPGSVVLRYRCGIHARRYRMGAGVKVAQL